MFLIFVEQFNLFSVSLKKLILYLEVAFEIFIVEKIFFKPFYNFIFISLDTTMKNFNSISRWSNIESYTFSFYLVNIRGI
jgi:hypothetical protein